MGTINTRPLDWKKINLKKFTKFIVNEQFIDEYRQLFVDEDDPKKGTTPARLFFLLDKEYGVAVVRRAKEVEYDYFEFGNKNYHMSNIAFLN